MSNHETQLVQLRRLAAFPDVAALPLEMRVLDVLVQMLIIADALLSDLQTEDAYELFWLEPDIERVYHDIDQAMWRLTQ